METFFEKVTGSFMALVEKGRAENEADERFAQTKRYLIQCLQCDPGNLELLQTLTDPPFLTLQLNIPCTSIQHIQEELYEIYISFIRKYGDRPMATIDGVFLDKRTE